MKKTAVLSVLILGLVGALAATPALADTTLYTNGAYKGAASAWNVGYGFAVSDSFTVPANSDIESLSIVYWDTSRTDILTTVDMAITSSSLPGSGFETIDAANTYLEFNGYYLFQADFTFPSIDWSGDGWITLQNACTTNGCSDSVGTAYWDENDGPSLAFQNTTEGPIGSEAFTLDGSGSVTATPEPSSFLLLGSGLAGLAGLLKRKLRA